MKTSEEILATVGYPGFVRALFNRTGDPSKDFAHAVLGLVTEIHEYIDAPDDVNALEEAGDLAFYLEALTQVLDDYSPIQYDAMEAFGTQAVERYQEFGLRLGNETTEWLDLAKRWIGYGKAPTMSGAQLVAEAGVLMSLVIRSGRLGDVEDDVFIAKANIDKLLVRYNGMAFNAERAVNRDLAAERTTLENA